MALSFTGIQIADTNTLASIFQELAQEFFFIVTLGFTRMDKYQKDSTSTTLTGMRSIMTFQTLSVCPQKIMDQNISLRHIQTREKPRHFSILRKLGLLPRLGTPLQRGEKNTEKSARLLTKILLQLQSLASIVERRFCQKLLATEVISAQTHASQHGGALKASTTLKKHAIAGINSLTANTAKLNLAISSVLDAKREKKHYNDYNLAPGRYK